MKFPNPFRMPPFPTFDVFMRDPEKAKDMVLAGYRRFIRQNRLMAVMNATVIGLYLMLLRHAMTLGEKLDWNHVVWGFCGGMYACFLFRNFYHERELKHAMEVIELDFKNRPRPPNADTNVNSGT